MAKFATQFDRPETKYEKGGGKKITEQAGYIPAKIQIENMIFAGQRLNASRAEMFDTTDDTEPEIDPTRGSNFDLADATALGRITEKRLKGQKAQIDKEKLEKATAIKIAEAQNLLDDKEVEK